MNRPGLMDAWTAEPSGASLDDDGVHPAEQRWLETFAAVLFPRYRDG
jgi:hypothetical protein